METNYFVCTLGQASTLNADSKPYRTIGQFLDYQSRSCGSNPAVGFPLPHNQKDWSCRLLTFEHVSTGTQVFAARLSKFVDSTALGPQTVALMAHSSPEFLFTWLGLMYLGHPVLLVAPQCQPSAIVHLCKACNVSVLFHDAPHRKRAQEAEELQDHDGDTVFRRCLIPLSEDEDIFQVIRHPRQNFAPASDVHESAVAYFHHTSGTSSGFPKPIPQSHRAAIGVLPHIPPATSKATFTTTPLYHGGIADTFRSWTSDSPIWLFPGKDVPITPRNICRCLEVANSCVTDANKPTIKYFSSVPYVLQMMEADDKGLELLKRMDIVGVGGAALPVEVGDRLVRSGVNLISRFGSAECGFLLSSYREFAKDKEWQYLRNHNPAPLLDFESRDNGLAELIVKPRWPHMAKLNRGDGSFATADLFKRHSEICNAWFYHSRADSQLTLVTGKKFDPAPLEAVIAAAAEQLSDVLIFGDNRPYPGMLLFRAKNFSHMPDALLLDAIWPQVEEQNKRSQDHARIARHMLIPVHYGDNGIEKSSKGTIIRKAAESKFAEYINAAYKTEEGNGSQNIDDEDLPRYLAGLIQSVIQNPDPPTEDTDLFSYGIDSIACMRVRSQLRQLLPDYNEELPLSIVEDCGTIYNLSKYIVRKRHGEADVKAKDENQLMLDLVKEFGGFSLHASSSQEQTDGHSVNNKSGEIVILTGATGALGAHVLHLLRSSDAISTIYCLVRGTDNAAARSRVSKALSQRGLPPLSSASSPNSKIHVLQAQFSEPHLGLSKAQYNDLAAHASLILHIAWTVNFRLKLSSFVKDNIAGLRYLLDLALAARRTEPPRFVYCSSTAAIIYGSPNASGLLPEHIVDDPASASPLGYSRSKWVAEHICLAAHRRTALHGRVAVVRIGQLSGASDTGVWNAKEAWPMMLSTAKLLGCLPDLGDEPVDWLPVDVAAKAFLQASRIPKPNVGSDQVDMHVYHVLNPHPRPTWSAMLHWFGKKAEFRVVQPKEWVKRLEGVEGVEHSSLKLLRLWKETYGDADGNDADKKTGPKFSISETEKRIEAMRDVRPVDEEYIGKVWDWVQANVH